MDQPVDAVSADLGESLQDTPRLGQMAPRVSTLYASVYLHYGYLSFLPLWLGSTGSTPGEIGTLMAIPLILRLLTVAPFSAWTGRHGWVRNGLAVTAFGSAILIAMLPEAHGHLARILLVVAFGMVWDQIPVLTDAYAVMAVRSQRLDFGRLRVWGSIAVIISNLSAGWLLDRLGILSLPYLVAGFLLLPTFACFLLPPDRTMMQDSPDAGGGWRELLSDKVLIASFAAVSLIVGSHGVLNNFGAIQWSAAGISEGQIGMLNAVAVVSELITFTFGARLLGRRDPRWMIALAAVAASIRWLIIASNPGVPVLFGAQLLQGVSATGAILAPMLMIARRLPTRLVPRAQGLNAVLLGAVLAFVTAGSGLLWQQGVIIAYLAMVALCLIAIPVLFAFRDAREPE
nr:MFS transporter [uncultured Hyphomonas sp.]